MKYWWLCQLGLVVHTYNLTLRKLREKGHRGDRARPGLTQRNRGWRDGSAVKKARLTTRTIKSRTVYKYPISQSEDWPKRKLTGHFLLEWRHTSQLSAEERSIGRGGGGGGPRYFQKCLPSNPHWNLPNTSVTGLTTWCRCLTRLRDPSDPFSDQRHP